MKEWKKPFCKVVVLEELLTDVICNSGHDDTDETPGIGLDRGNSQDVSNSIWKN